VFGLQLECLFNNSLEQLLGFAISIAKNAQI
jgi:hypothetical protein